MTFKQHVEYYLNKGFTPVIHMEKAIKDMSRTQFNRANQWEQDTHAKRQKEAGMKPVYYLESADTYTELTKTQYDYALSLIDGRA